MTDTTNCHYSIHRDFTYGSDRSAIPAVKFFPGQQQFAACYKDLDRVGIFDVHSLKLIRAFSNPDANLDGPHGLAITENHLIVSNKHETSDIPSTLNVYRSDSVSGKPVYSLATPFADLREAHSLAVSNDRLVVTYCGKHIGAVVVYGFDDSSGEITEPVSIVRTHSLGLSEPKGVSFDRDCSRVFVSVVTERSYRLSDKFRRFSGLARTSTGRKKVLTSFLKKPRKLMNYLSSGEKEKADLENGVLELCIDSNGVLDQDSLRLHNQDQFCRLENVDIVDEYCVLSDPINNRISILDINNVGSDADAIQVIEEGLSFPHDAVLSKSQEWLLVANNGLQVIDGRPQWGNYVEGRGDRIIVFKRSCDG
ncbi:MAG: YncE family protein [bacterium]